MIAVLLLAGLFVTLRLSFIQLRQCGHAIRAVLGRYDDPDDEGDISHFQALSTALSATVGIGNIAGVAMAIHYGGPGALFWMWVTAIFGMALKFAECTLSMHYRGFDADGNASGGPMYYIEKGLGPKWKPLAIFFAVCAVISSFGGGNMNQANTVAVSAYSDFGIEGWVVGLVSATLVGIVILGGIKRIAKVSSTLAPTMAAIYISGALLILIMNVDAIPGAFAEIFSQAFNPRASLGGSVAGVFSMTLLWGVKRGLFSNEAGQGSAPIAHAAAKTKEPVREGAVAMLGPLIDTLIICTMTGLVIVTTGVWDEKKQADLGIREVKTYASASVPEKGSSEAARVATAVGIAENADPKLGLAALCQAGRCPSLAFVGRDAFIDAAVLEVKTADGSFKPYDGAVTLQVQAAALKPPKEGGKLKFRVRGKMLQNSSALTAWAFDRGLSPIGDWGNLLVTFSVFLFALSTMISWSYYGDRCIEYLFGARFVLPYRLVYVVFVFIGSVAALRIVWDFGDLALGLMAVPNLIAVVLLMPEVVKITNDYFKRMAAGGGDAGSGDAGAGDGGVDDPGADDPSTEGTEGAEA